MLLFSVLITITAKRAAFCAIGKISVKPGAGQHSCPLRASGLRRTAQDADFRRQNFFICYFSGLEQESSMGDLIHTSRARIYKDKGPLRRAYIEGFPEPVRYGVHGGIKKFYGIEPEEELPATLDHIVAAVAS
jgi:hypothetical protein